MGTLNKRYAEGGHGRDAGEKSPGPRAAVSGNAGGLERDVVEAGAGSGPAPGDAASDPRHHACPRGSGEGREGFLRAAWRRLASEVGRVAVARPALRLPRLNRRQRTLLGTFLLGAVVALVIASSFVMSDARLATDLDERDIPPSLGHPFGTDWLGRDMLVRTVKGLTLSLGVGVFASVFSVAIALALGLLAASGVKAADAVVSWLVDFFLGLPHLVFLILIAFVLGGGVFAVVVGVALTHWPSLARVVRAEVLQLRTAEYIQASPHFGRSRWWMARKHFLPHLVPQLIVGFVLLVPHAILHEASITFLGFGLSPHRPAVGIILSEAMRYLTAGKWWLALMPGLSLVALVGMIFALGDNLRALLDPHTAHE